MTTTSGLSAYLLEQKTRFLGDNGDGWTVVMGNEAGDLDSLASSIGFAWFLSHKLNTDANAIALITTPREDFVLRAENLYALQLVGIKEDFRELLCPEDVPKPNLCTDFALVDHNSLHPNYALPDVRVTAIIDHHEDEGKYLDTASPRSIEPAGSCASLVTRVIMSYPTLQIPPELATLLLNAIVIDTHGLRRGGKAVGVDYEAFTWLVPRANVPSSGSLIEQMAETPQHVPDLAWIQSLTHTLNTKKTALSHLNTRDLLRRDYKEYVFNLSSSIRGDSPCSVKAGLSTVPLPLSSFFSPSPTSAVVSTQEWIKERGLSILGVLTTYKSKQGKPKRELMWVVDEKVCGPRLPQVLFDGIEANEILQVKRTDFKRYGFNSQVGKDEKERDEVEWGSIDEEESVGEPSGAAETSPFDVGFVVRVYRQKNSAVTRKQVAPILKRVLEG
ncbi:DHH phosphoesterase [Boletus edulis]|nr:DHH phosphoesterase [Boletus edulis]